MVEPAGWQRAQADADAQAFFQSVLDGSLEGYQVAFIAEPTLPRWAEVLGAKPVYIPGSVGSRQWVLLRSIGERRAATRPKYQAVVD